MRRGRRALSSEDVKEIIALYVWGARMTDLVMLYDVHRRTIKDALRHAKCALRPSHRMPLANAMPHSGGGSIKSIRPKLPEGALIDASRLTPDQLLSSSARAQRDRRIVGRQAGASSRSCPEEVS